MGYSMRYIEELVCMSVLGITMFWKIEIEYFFSIWGPYDGAHGVAL